MRRQFTSDHPVSRRTSCPFDWPQKDERLSQAWSHPVWKMDPWIPNRPMTHEVVVLDTTFLWWKKLKILNGSFQWYSWSKNPTGLELTFEKKFPKVLSLCFTPAKVVLHSPRGHWNPFSITLVVEITQNIPSVLIFRVQSQYCIAICKNTMSCRRAN